MNIHISSFIGVEKCVFGPFCLILEFSGVDFMYGLAQNSDASGFLAAVAITTDHIVIDSVG